jgi:hypothetical protein
MLHVPCFSPHCQTGASYPTAAKISNKHACIGILHKAGASKVRAGNTGLTKRAVGEARLGGEVTEIIHTLSSQGFYKYVYSGIYIFRYLLW